MRSLHIPFASKVVRLSVPVRRPRSECVLLPRTWHASFFLLPNSNFCLQLARIEYHRLIGHTIGLLARRYWPVRPLRLVRSRRWSMNISSLFLSLFLSASLNLRWSESMLSLHRHIIKISFFFFDICMCYTYIHMIFACVCVCVCWSMDRIQVALIRLRRRLLTVIDCIATSSPGNARRISPNWMKPAFRSTQHNK